MSKSQEAIKKLICKPRINFVELVRVAEEIGIHHNTLRAFITAPEAVESATREKIEAWVEKQKVAK
jgi:hypothetical protein